MQKIFRCEYSSVKGVVKKIVIKSFFVLIFSRRLYFRIFHSSEQTLKSQKPNISQLNKTVTRGNARNKRNDKLEVQDNSLGWRAGVTGISSHKPTEKVSIGKDLLLFQPSKLFITKEIKFSALDFLFLLSS